MHEPGSVIPLARQDAGARRSRLSGIDSAGVDRLYRVLSAIATARAPTLRRDTWHSYLPKRPMSFAEQVAWAQALALMDMAAAELLPHGLILDGPVVDSVLDEALDHIRRGDETAARHCLAVHLMRRDTKPLRRAP